MEIDVTEQSSYWDVMFMEALAKHCFVMSVCVFMNILMRFANSVE
jgi:hypothetical protein